MLPLHLEAVPSLRHSVWLQMLLGRRALNGLSVGGDLGVPSVLVQDGALPCAARAVTSAHLLNLRFHARALDELALRQRLQEKQR